AAGNRLGSGDAQPHRRGRLEAPGRAGLGQNGRAAPAAEGAGSPRADGMIQAHRPQSVGFSRGAPMSDLVAYLLLFTGTGIGFILFNMTLGKVFRPAKMDAEKATVYECGEP